MTSEAPKLHDVLRAGLGDIDSGWSIGAYGAIGEFHQRPDDVRIIDDPDHLTRVTEKGGLFLDRACLDTVVPIAYETLSPRPNRWGQGVVLCLKDGDARGPCRAAITELGPDHQALRPENRDALLFDLGLAQPHIDFCVRTDNPALIDILRRSVGTSILAPNSAANAAILLNHPHRVVMSKLARIEVYQKIGGRDTGGVSPDGPHTHLLPKLLKVGRTHAANIPVPSGLTPCTYLHPPSPVAGAAGEDIAFSRERFEAFQALLRAFGSPAYVTAKNRVFAASHEDTEPVSPEQPGNRRKRTAVRIALRQITRLAIHASDDRRLAWARRWREVYDRVADNQASHGTCSDHEGLR